MIKDRERVWVGGGWLGKRERGFMHDGSGRSILVHKDPTAPSGQAPESSLLEGA